MWRFSTPRLLVVVLMVVVGGKGAALPQDQNGQVDIVLLVDSSGSMAIGERRIIMKDRLKMWDRIQTNARVVTDNPPADPQRLRYEAVRLVAQLLGEDDRLLVARCNAECPPNYGTIAKSGGEEREVSEQLKRIGLTLDSLGRLQSAEFDFQFSQSGDKTLDALIAKADFFNRTDDPGGVLDYGGTSIAGALDTIKQFVTASRQTHVLILTDGCDNDWLATWKTQPNGPDRAREKVREKVGQWRDMPRVHFHCLSLGFSTASGPNDQYIGDQLLLELAAEGRGTFEKIDGSDKLISTYVHRVRQFRELWYYAPRPPDASENDRESLLLTERFDHIKAFYLLVFEEDPAKTRAKVPRNTDPPHREVGLQWQPREPYAPTVVTGKEGRVYKLYKWLQPVSPGTTLAAHLHSSKGPVHAFLLKSTVKPIFRLQEDMRQSWFRPETMTIKVTMDTTSGFQPTQFQAGVRLVPYQVGRGRAAHASENPQESFTPLVWDDKENAFVARIYLMNLPQSQEAYDFYQLLVQVRGVGSAGTSHSLTNYVLDLSPRTIRVENKAFVTFSALSIELSDSKKINSEIRICDSVEEPCILQCELKTSDEFRNVIVVEYFDSAENMWKPVGSPTDPRTTMGRGSAERLNIPVVKGTVPIRFGFAPGATVRGDTKADAATFRVQRASFTASRGMTTLPIDHEPVKVRIVMPPAMLRLKVNPPKLRITSDQTSRASLVIENASPDGPGADHLVIRVSTVYRESSNSQLPELDVSLERNGVRVADRTRPATGLKIGDQLALVVQPTTVGGATQSGQIVLQLSGRGASDLTHTIPFEYEAPSLAIDAITVDHLQDGKVTESFSPSLKERPLTVHTGRPSHLRVSVRVEFKGVATQKDVSLSVDPMYSRQGIDEVRVQNVRNTATLFPDSLSAQLTFELVVGNNAFIGPYHFTVTVRCDELRQRETFPLVLLVDEMTLEMQRLVNFTWLWVPHMAGPVAVVSTPHWRLVPLRNAAILHLLDQGGSYTLRARRGLNDPSAEHTLWFVGRLQHASGHEIGGVEISPFAGDSSWATLTLPAVTCAFKWSPYRLEIRARKGQLETRDYIQVYFAEPNDVVELTETLKPISGQVGGR